MAHEMLIGLDVKDDERYGLYRLAMTPILESFGGSFGYDFRVEEVLIAQGDDPINRVFTLRFPDLATKEAFFSDPGYLRVRSEYFDGSVGATTRIASYEN